MEESVLTMNGVMKHRDSLLFGPVDLQLPKGYVFAIVGPNGSGKSTLLNIALELLHPDAGTASLLGQRLDKPLDRAIKQKIGYVPEVSSRDEDHFTLEQLAKFTAHWYPGWSWSKYDEFVAKFQLKPTQKFGKMSKGVRRKCELTMALSCQPELLILDEPSSGLDPFAWKMMVDELRGFMDQGDRTVILSTHIVDEMKRLADYIVFVFQGQVLGMFEKDSLLDNWKEMWVTEETGMAQDAGELPGLVEWGREAGGMIRLVSSDASATERTMREFGWNPVKTRTLELDETLLYLIQRKQTMREEKS
ncbi:ABC transporter ATP-binding protein [Paenibacillus sp. MSJ-34]|uniref:ABC transporter ATP-binding protein n=1 Tax=Paenibacillus sp. MSJ-34 TaxID=2841529 RepID=UPI001C125CAB|nr:ABC transporter ATP-binding protein [Paenibacillus sp. MSJ-34]MBU5441053.1 ABC transporter ATP-binding protein [Paenibacillus sp. MSJ-34]